MPDNICTVTAVAEPRPDGERITKAVIEFTGDVPDVGSIQVKNRNITGREVSGHTVTLTLCEDDEDAFVFPSPKHQGPPADHKPGDGTRPRIPERHLVPVRVTVILPDGIEVESTISSEPVIEKFSQGEFKSLLYNLFVPENLEEGRKYPLVMFMPDASVNGEDAKMALAQGIGGTVWAEPEWQEEHPCYVLAIQIPKGVHLTTDEYTCSEEINDVKELIDTVIDSNSVDRDRVYATGQSQGCMASCYLNTAYPDLFAASLLVSGHWNPDTMLKLTNARFIFGLSSGAPKENINFNLLTEGYEKLGVKVDRVHLNFRDGWDVNNAKVREITDGDAQMLHVIFDGETAFPDDDENRPMIAHHNRGWELTYQLKPVREWLFRQHR